MEGMGSEGLGEGKEGKGEGEMGKGGEMGKLGE